MKNEFGCQYCHKRRSMDLYAGMRKGKKLCTPCKKTAESNVRNHDKAEALRKRRRPY